MNLAVALKGPVVPPAAGGVRVPVVVPAAGQRIELDRRLAVPAFGDVVLGLDLRGERRVGGDFEGGKRCRRST